MSLFQIVYDAGPNGLWVFLLCNVLLGCGAAYVMGKAVAETWRPVWQVATYAVLLGLAVRFMHFALFEEVLLSGRNFLIDVALLLVAGLAGYVTARKRQMVGQYGWRRAG